MRIDNVHERWLAAGPRDVWELVETMGSEDDRLWPRGWPRCRLDGPLESSPRGGHGPIRYHVTGYEAGRAVRFAFDRPRGAQGHHAIDVTSLAGGTLLRHVIHLDAGAAFVPWWFTSIRWLHDALLEDLLDRAELQISGSVASPARWSATVRALRLAGG